MQPTRQMRLYKRRIYLRSICPIHVHPLYDVQPRVLIGFAARVWYFSLLVFPPPFFTRVPLFHSLVGEGRVARKGWPRLLTRLSRVTATSSSVTKHGRVWFCSVDFDSKNREGEDDKVWTKFLKFSTHYSWDFDAICV